jgi:hypothetical protein
MAIILNPYGGGTLIGSIGSTTFQRGRYGNLARARVKPVDPNTPRQQEVKTYMTQASAEFGAISAASMAQWNSYALNTPIIGPKGTQIVLTGRQMYMRSRMFQLRGTLGPLLTAPSTPGVLPIPSCTFTYDVATGVVALTAISAVPTNYAIRFLISRNLGPSRNYWKGPFETTHVEVSTITPPVTIATIAPVPVAGEKVYVKFKAWDADTNKVCASSIVEVIAA